MTTGAEAERVYDIKILPLVAIGVTISEMTFTQLALVVECNLNVLTSVSVGGLSFSCKSQGAIITVTKSVTIEILLVM